MLAGAGLLVLVLALLGIVAAYDWRNERQSTRQQNELVARVLADAATRSIESASLAAATLGDMIHRDTPADGPEMRAAISQTLASLPFVRGIGLIDPQGRIVASSAEGERGLIVDLDRLGPLPSAGREVIGHGVRGRLLSDLARDAPSAVIPEGVGFLPLLRHVALADGKALYLVVMLNADAFANFQESTLHDPRSAAALLSYDGRLIAATSTVQLPADADRRWMAPFTQFLPRHEHGSWIGPGLRGGTQIAAFRVSATRPVVVVVESALADVLADWSGEATLLAIAALAAALVISASTVIAARNIGAREAARRQLDDAQAEVARRERELSVTIKSLQEVVFRTDAAGRVTFVNERLRALTGIEPASLVGRPLWDIGDPDQRPLVRALFALDGPQALRTAQVQATHADGQVRHFELAVMALQREAHVIGFAGSAVDVSDRVVAQAKLGEQVAFLRELMEVTPLPISVTDADGRYLLVNKAWETFSGLTNEQAIGMRAGARLPEPERRLHDEQNALLKRSGVPLRFEATVTRGDGARRDAIVSKLLLPVDDTGHVGIMSVLVDVTELRDAERATREARDAAEEASRTKSEFIANISHELRTPLQSIIGFSELGIVRAGDALALGTMFGDIHRAGQRMLALVNDLLDVSKIESSVGTLSIEHADLRLLVSEVVRELGPLIADRQLRVDIELPEVSLKARVDPLRFQQVVRNVVANAIRFSPAGGRIEVRGERAADGRLRFTVADRGPGIPDGELETVFEPFVQSSKTKDGSGGTGLGLAICRRIVESHGGSIAARHRPGGGAIFEILLPEDAGTGSSAKSG